MKKILSLFQRNYETDRLVRDEVVPGTEWVLAGEGVATIKWDGTACMVKCGILYKRYDAKASRLTPAPAGFIPAQNPDEVTDHWPGWLPVGLGAEDMWHREAFSRAAVWADGTYELCGPKVNKNPEHLEGHYLLKHGESLIEPAPARSFSGIRDWLRAVDIEGIVWHHPDGRMVKIKKKDFGLPRIPTALEMPR